MCSRAPQHRSCRCGSLSTITDRPRHASGVESISDNSDEHVTRLPKPLNPFEIWTTYGPSIDDPEVLARLLRAGATGARFNFSYGTPELQIQRAQGYRHAAALTRSHVTLIADLPGEKIRITDVPGDESISLTAGQRVRLEVEGALCHVDETILRVTHLGSLRHSRRGDALLLGDGSVELEIQSVDPTVILASVTVGGEIENGRGVVLRGRMFAPVSLTPTDIAHLELIAQSNVFDLVALSFVSCSDDVKLARDTLAAFGKELPIAAKIETQLGVDSADEIAEIADVVIAGRGDLALTADWLDLPLHVAAIADAANRVHKPWIIATQLMEGLDRFAIPTRAEICDLHHWIEKGAAGALLSHETAFGTRPVAAVTCVAEIARHHVIRTRTMYAGQPGHAPAQ